MLANLSTAICQWIFLLLTLVMIIRSSPLLLPCAKVRSEVSTNSDDTTNNPKQLSRSSIISILRQAIRENNFGILGTVPKDDNPIIRTSSGSTKLRFDLAQVTNYLKQLSEIQHRVAPTSRCGRKCRRRKRKRRRQKQRSRATGPSHHISDLLKSNKPPVVITKASQVKQDWCRTEPLKQRIKEPRCRPKNLLNNFCYGQCNSFYIPKTNVDANTTSSSGSAFQSCAFCKPLKTTWVTVRLHCPGLIPPFRQKSYLKVQKCRCLSEILR